MLKSSDYDKDSKMGKIISRTADLFKTLSDANYDVEVAFDNGESQSNVLLGQQGGKVVITINDDIKPLKAYTSGNFELNDENQKILTNIQDLISNL